MELGAGAEPSPSSSFLIPSPSRPWLSSLAWSSSSTWSWSSSAPGSSTFADFLALGGESYAQILKDSSHFLHSATALDCDSRIYAKFPFCEIGGISHLGRSLIKHKHSGLQIIILEWAQSNRYGTSALLVFRGNRRFQPASRSFSYRRGGTKNRMKTSETE